MQRFRVATRQIILHGLLHVCERDLPGIIHQASGGELADGEEFAVVDAVMQQNLLRSDTLDMNRENGVIAGDNFRQLGVIAWLDVDKLGVGGSNYVGEKGAPGR